MKGSAGDKADLQDCSKRPMLDLSAPFQTSPGCGVRAGFLSAPIPLLALVGSAESQRWPLIRGLAPRAGL
jgi:hypothetical protein